MLWACLSYVLAQAVPPPWAVPLTETTGASLYGESPGVSSQSLALCPPPLARGTDVPEMA